MTPAEPSPLALFWRAVWRSTLAGALIGAGYGALVLALTEVSSPGAQRAAPDLLGRSFSAALAGGYFGLIFGALSGLVGGVVLGAIVALAWRRTSPESARARPLGLLVGLVPAALLTLVMVGGDLRALDPRGADGFSLLFVVIPVALMLGWLWFEAGALARWRR